MEEQSDDEIFFGKVTLNEIKKLYGVKNRPGSYSENKAFENIKTEPNASINIIETHSQPNLRSVKEEKPTFYSKPGSPAFNRESVDDSFIKLENQVSELCMAPRTSDDIELNNTLEVIDYILNNGPIQKTEATTPIKDENSEKLLPIKKTEATNPIKDENSEKLLPIIQENSNIGEEKKESLLSHYTLKEIGPIEIEKTPSKNIKIKHPHKGQVQADPKDSERYFTPVKSEKKEVFATPCSSSIKLKPPVFKTPAPLSNKKTVTSAKKTPNRTNAYQHIASPIASYIKNCPQVPLVKDVHPKKPLPGPSSIPKYVKSLPIKSQNKENIDLPKVAYKSAKKTVLINVDEEKLPQSQWVKSTLPRPKVVKHEKREMNPLKVRGKQEESFANLSYLQAEVSVCTQKTAFKSNK